MSLKTPASLPLRAFQSTFKVQHPESVSQVSKVVRNRRTHTKSRGGCRACKIRRVKCDEDRPKCTRCSRLNIGCQYACAPGTLSWFVEGLSSTNSPDSTMFSLSIDVQRQSLAKHLTAPQNTTTPFTMVPDLDLLQHFRTATVATLGSAAVQQLIEECLSGPAWTYQCVMHTILAIAAKHLLRLKANDDCERFRRDCAIASGLHWHKGLISYRANISSCSGKGMSNDPVLINTALLMVFCSNTLENEMPLNALAVDYNDAISTIMEPIAASSGVGPLLLACDLSRATKTMLCVLLEADDQEGTYSCERSGIDGLPQSLIDLCELDADSNAANNVYHPIVRALTPLLLLSPGLEHFQKLISFGGRTYHRFRALLHERDERALLLMAVWLSLLSSIDQWWLENRVRSQCLAIVQHLKTSKDARIQKLVHFPASLGTTDPECFWQPLASLTTTV